MSGACDDCLARSWLLERVSGHLAVARSRIQILLGLDDEPLVAAVAPGQRREILGELARFSAEKARRRAETSELELLCRCQPRYPPRLRALAAPPAVLHVAGGLERFLSACADEPVAVVGARRASSYGLEMARALGRGLSASGLGVVSGMALGVDSAAHLGAVEVHGPTIAVLPGPADQAYPASRRQMLRSILRTGSAISELPPGSSVRSWSFPARNRTMAGLAALTIVVEATARSGSLVTAELALAMGRPVGAVPGRTTSPLAEGTNELLARGAHVVRHAGDALDLLFGAGERSAPDLRPPVSAHHAVVLAALAAGEAPGGAFAAAGLSPAEGLAALSALELAGRVRRGAGGRFTVVP